MSRPLCELRRIEITQAHLDIGKNVAGLIEDGSTLQLGIGSIPNAVLLALKDHRDLGVHTEMLSDLAIPLIESGVINGSRKTIHPRKIILGFVLGSKKLFDYVNNNPQFEFHPSKYTNDPYIISQNYKMAAVNSGVQVDITAQFSLIRLAPISTAALADKWISFRGASHCKGGKPIIALPATAKDETISRIVPMLDPGAGVVTSRGSVHYVVTEFGVAYLHAAHHPPARRSVDRDCSSEIPGRIVRVLREDAVAATPRASGEMTHGTSTRQGHH